MPSYLQKILFGGPGVGKSHKIASILQELNITEGNYTKTVFHPEYSYGDFMGKLLPLTMSSKVVYEYYPGYFLQTLAQAYKNKLINNNNPQPVALVIDEINRGNSAAIFGTVFQLLDRDDDGWSCYETKLSEMEYLKLLQLVGIEFDYSKQEYNISQTLRNHINTSQHIFLKNHAGDRQKFNEEVLKPLKISNKSIRIPPNMSIIATMNTSDNSIFYMDSAFKRRWGWEFIRGERQKALIDQKYDWCDFVDRLNKFFVDNNDSIRQIEDKQIGYWFIKAKDENISKEEIKNKLLFFIWDSVFSRDKSGLKKLLKIDKLITFDQFTAQCDNFLHLIINY
jgi:5-methylcytosine-specific restriction endonuclease McrBC GTP-binding regulatory subunit McrB